MNIHFGVDYYPEHWPEERWQTDAKLMNEMGVQVVRMAEFSWHKLEPQDGRFDLTWLDNVIELLGKYRIKTIIGTPSAAPPSWMINKYPDILPVDREGRTRGFGGRHHDCQSNPTYRKYVTRMVTTLAEHYCQNKNVIGWQPDNELGNSHNDLCTCDNCKKNFQTWLKKKYTTVENLNKAWGTAFWSQEINSFEEVFTPKITVTGENPSYMLDWNCFCSDLIVDFFKLQADIIRKHAPHQFITHNFMGFADKVDYYDLAKQVDFVSQDQYPGGFFVNGNHEQNHMSAANLDGIRSYKNQPFWIMEQQSGITGWQILGRTPIPGQLSAWTIQSIAHGADAIVYFRWRVCAVGTEQYWHGILPHSGNPGRRYFELQKTIKQMTPIMDEFQGSMPKAQVGIIFSFKQDYAFKIQQHHPDFYYMREIDKYYKPFYDKKIEIDFLPDSADFSKYKLIVAPLQYLMTKELEDKFFDYVNNGGHLVLTIRTGVKDATNLCMTEMELPGRLGKLAGLEVLDYDCLRTNPVKIAFDEKEYTGNIWSDLIKTNGSTKTIATYESEFYAHEPAITENIYGKGKCYYVGTEPDAQLMDALIEKITQDADIKKLGSTFINKNSLNNECSFTDVELCSRENDSYKWIFAINHSEQIQHYRLNENSDLLEFVIGKERETLQPFEYHIYKRKKD